MYARFKPLPIYGAARAGVETTAKANPNPCYILGADLDNNKQRIGFSMPPKKRKAASMAKEEEEQPKPKLSKREIRTQAIERARQSMQGDKKRVEAAKAKKSGNSPAKAEKEYDSARKRRKTEVTEKEEPAPAKTSTKTKTASSPKRTTAKSKANETEPPVKDPTKDLEPLPVNSPTAQMTSPLAQWVSQATGASAFTEQGVGAAPNANQTLMNQYMLQQQQQQQQLYGQHLYGYGNQAAYGSTGYANPYNGIAQQQAAYAGAYPGQFGQAHQGFPPYYGASLEQAQQLTHQIQLQQQQQPAAVSVSSKNGSSPKRTKAAANKTEAAKAAKAAFLPPPSVPGDDEDMPPPPPSLEVQISQQVMANLAASEQNQPTPHSRPPPEAFVNSPMDSDGEEEEVVDENPIVIDEDCIYIEEPSATTSTRSDRKIFLGAFIIAILSYLMLQEEGDLVSTSGAAPCFIDNIAIGDSGEMMHSCADDEGVDCPDGGICKYGKLVDCPSKHYQLSENKDHCFLTDVSMESITAIQGILEPLTLEQGCHFAADEYPLFPYKDIQLANPLLLAINPLELGILENKFHMERREGVHYIGLPSDFQPNLPFRCQIVSTLKSIFGGFASLFFAGIHFCLATSLKTFMAYPLGSIIGLVVAFLLRRILSYRAYRKQLVTDVAEIRQVAYGYLEETPEESHLVLHVRDHIVMNYPKSQRQYLIKDVWPRVVPDFTYDNRIRKSTRVVMGQPRDAWQWVAAVSAKKKTRNSQ